MSAAFGYAAGWNPYASDYTRYLPATTRRWKIGLAAGLGNFVSCTVLMAAGAAAATVVELRRGGANPTDLFTGTASMPALIGKITLLAIAVGAIAANALNLYSGAMSFLAMGIRIPLTLRRALVAGGFGVIGFFIALAALAERRATYENFLLVIAYWIAPWLGVVLADRCHAAGHADRGVPRATTRGTQLARPHRVRRRRRSCRSGCSRTRRSTRACWSRRP